MSVLTETRPPRGAVIVVVVGVIATIAAALLATESSGASSAKVEWEKGAGLPPSQPAAIRGGGSMRLGDARIEATESNANREFVYRTSAVLTIGAGSAVGRARVRCRMRGGPQSELARTVDSRGAFPRSSGEYNLTKQEVPGNVGIRLPIQGAEYASLEFKDAFEAFTKTPGVVVSWAPHKEKAQEWQWGLPEGRPAKPISLGFASFWRSSGPAQAQISCSLENNGGAATVQTAGVLGG